MEARRPSPCLEQVRAAIRVRHYSIRTEDSYLREALAQDLERHVFAVGDAVRVEKLENHFLELFNQRFHIVRFSGKTGDLIARRDPDPDFIVPYRIDD